MIELPKTRKDVPDGSLWKPEHIYKTQEDWEADFAYVKENAAKLAECAGTLKDGCAAVLNALRIYAEAGEHLSRLYTYAATNLNSDNSDSFYQGLIARAEPCHAVLRRLGVPAAGASQPAGGDARGVYR